MFEQYFNNSKNIIILKKKSSIVNDVYRVKITNL